jgi:hypothetical protein
VTTFGCEQLIGQVYRVFKLTRDMLPADGRGHKVHFCTIIHQCSCLHRAPHLLCFSNTVCVVSLQRLGRRVAAAHLLQLTLMFYLGAVLKSQHMTAPGQLRASFAIFGLVYALQVGVRLCELTHSSNMAYIPKYFM